MKLEDRVEYIYKYIKEDGAGLFADGHAVYTPQALVEEILGRIEDLDKSKQVLVLFNIEFVVSLVYTRGINSNNITFYSDSVNKTAMASRMGVRVVTSLENLNMKFDVVVGNPPFSEKSKASDKLWAKFTIKAMDMLSDHGVLGFITPSGWTSSANIAHSSLKGKIKYVSFAASVSDSFGNVGGTQRFTYFIAGAESRVGLPLCKFDDVEIELDPLATPFAPQKSSSHLDFTIVEKIYNSLVPVHDWKRVDYNDPTPAVVMPMAKAASYEVKYGADVFDGSRYKLQIDEKTGHSIANNLNLKLYRNLRWILRSGPALAGNFKLVPVPVNEMADSELYAHFNLTQEEIAHIEANVK